VGLGNVFQRSPHILSTCPVAHCTAALAHGSPQEGHPRSRVRCWSIGGILIGLYLARACQDRAIRGIGAEGAVEDNEPGDVVEEPW
jgi:hypothetical protein